MNKYKMILGAAVLAIAGIAIGKASYNFSSPTALYSTTSGIVCNQLASSIISAPLKLTTNTGIGLPVYLVAGGSHRLSMPHLVDFV